MLKFIFLEGLPGVGKTYLLNYIKSLKIKNVHVVDEIINENILNGLSCTEIDFIKNDEMKLTKYKEGIIIVDRGPISSLSYTQAKTIITGGSNYDKAIDVFNKYLDIWQRKSKTLYLSNFSDKYSITVRDENSPYGTIDNQRLLESITLFNLKKYSINYRVINYKDRNYKVVVDEITN